MNALIETVLIAQLAATSMMAGVIWIVQLLVYPSFADVAATVDRREWQQFHARHSRRISFVVGPAMIVEAICALWLLIALPASIPAALIASGAGLVAINWATTILVSSRHHARLSSEAEMSCIGQLIAVNWLRTAAWSARFALAVVMCLVA